MSVTPGSAAAEVLQANDVILAWNGKQVNNLKNLEDAHVAASGKNTQIVIFRNQKLLNQEIKIE